MSGPSNEEVAAVFDRAAESYDSAIPFFARFGRRLVEVAEVKAGESVLDVAAGRGASLIPAARAVGAGGRVVGVDLAPVMVEMLQRDLVALDLPQASAQVGNAEHLDFPDDGFDVVQCGFTLMLVPHPEQVAAEFARVLKPGGRVAVSMPTGAGPEWSFLRDLFVEFAPRALRPIPPPAPPIDLAEVVAGAGFSEPQTFDEVERFTFASFDECWRWVWSQGMRAMLEHLPDDALAELRAVMEQRVQAIAQSDGSIPLDQSVRYVIATRASAVA